MILNKKISGGDHIGINQDNGRWCLWEIYNTTKRCILSLMFRKHGWHSQPRHRLSRVWHILSSLHPHTLQWDFSAYSIKSSLFSHPLNLDSSSNLLSAVQCTESDNVPVLSMQFKSPCLCLFSLSEPFHLSWEQVRAVLPDNERSLAVWPLLPQSS